MCARSNHNADPGERATALFRARPMTVARCRRPMPAASLRRCANGIRSHRCRVRSVLPRSSDAACMIAAEMSKRAVTNGVAVCLTFLGIVVTPHEVDAAEGHVSAAAPSAGVERSSGFEWLLGEWTIAGADREFRMSWLTTDGGAEGRLERVERDGTRSLAAEWTISRSGDGLLLSVHRLIEASVAGLLSDEIIERIPGRRAVHWWPRYPKAGRRARLEQTRTYGGRFVTPNYLAFSAAGNAVTYMTSQFPLSIQLRVVQGKLLVAENHGNKKFKKYDEFFFVPR